MLKFSERCKIPLWNWKVFSVKWRIINILGLVATCLVSYIIFSGGIVLAFDSGPSAFYASTHITNTVHYSKLFCPRRKNVLKNNNQARHHWLMLVILATQEAEIRKIEVQS
jgi:hypothetical protein